MQPIKHDIRKANFAKYAKTLNLSKLKINFI